MITAICFDFDGTLGRFQGDFGAWVDGIRTDLGLLHCDFREFSARLNGHLRLDGVVTLRSALEETVRGLGLEPVGLDEAVERALARYRAGVGLLPGASELLDRLEGHPLAIVSNGPEDMQRAAIAGIADRFGIVVISGAPGVGARKPAARPFALAAEALGRPPSETVMIGDDLVGDIEGALAFGMPAVRVGGPGNGRYAGLPDLLAVRAWIEPRLRGLP